MAHATKTLDPDRLNIGSVASRLGVPGLLVGVIALIAAAVMGLRSGDGMTVNHFFFSYLTAYSFFMAITLGCLLFVLIQYLTRAGWSVTVRRVAEGASLNIFLMIVLVIPFVIPVTADGVRANGIARLFPWFSPEAQRTDELIIAKSGYMNPQFFAIRMLIYFVFWFLLAWYFSSKSAEQDQSGDPAITKKLELVAMPSIILFAFSLTAFAFDWIMALNPHWFSTIFGIYYFAGAMLSGLSIIVLLCLSLQKRGLLGKAVDHEHYHDLGKLMFTFTFFWGYIAFAQYMLIWYANMPDETQFFIPRQIHHWGSLSLVLLTVHLLIPFPGLLSRHMKRKNTFLAFWAVWSLCACAVDQYWLIMPNEWIAGNNGIAMEVTGSDPAHFAAPNPNVPLPDVLPKLIDGANPDAARYHIYDVSPAHQKFQDEHINYPFRIDSVIVTVLCFIGIGGLYLFSTMLALRNKSLVPTKDPRLPEALAFENI